MTPSNGGTSKYAICTGMASLQILPRTL
ncbi:hypothetical protein A2U01_0015648, partial [Trifolium medium]|nr:hypothetical protein [Trifolium medium]